MTIKAREEPPGPHDPDRILTRALLAACPSIGTVWAEHLAEWAPEQPPVYIDTGVFAGHLIDLLDTAQTTELGAVFEVVDRLLRTGDPDVRYLVTYDDDPSGSRLRAWFLPATDAAWAE